MQQVRGQRQRPLPPLVASGGLEKWLRGRAWSSSGWTGSGLLMAV